MTWFAWAARMRPCKLCACSICQTFSGWVHAGTGHAECSATVATPMSRGQPEEGAAAEIDPEDVLPGRY